MKKITEHTYGNHVYMKLMIEVNGKPETHAIDVYWGKNGEETYKTSADGDSFRRDEIIKAFNALY